MNMITCPAKRKSYNCYSGGICYLLERKGTYLSEHTSFGLSAGLNFEVHIKDQLSFYAVRALHCLTDFIYSLGVEVVEYPEDSFDTFLVQTKKQIESNMPLMAEYDGFYFPFTQIFQKKHDKRIAMVVGYDSSNLYISDFIYSAYEVPISYELFEQAVSPFKGACVTPKWYDVNFPVNVDEKITSELVVKSIDDVYKHFLDVNLSDDNKLIGIAGIRTFSKKMQEIMQSPFIKIDWADFSEDIKQAVITFRYYGDFIKDITANNLLYIPIEDAQKIQALFYDVSALWRIISNLFFRYSLTQKDTLQPKIGKNMSDSADILEEAFALLGKSILQYKE